MIQDRISWEEYALLLAEVASKRSEDPYKKTGACVLRFDKSIAGLGYNGAPRGLEIDWSNRDERRKFVIHAEINALTHCKPNELWLLACDLMPCSECMKTIAAYGIKRVVYREKYLLDSFAEELAKIYKINLIQLKQ
jgi:dCMP deaminase